MPYRAYRYTPGGKPVDDPKAYCVLTDSEHASLEAILNEAPGRHPLVERMLDPYKDCVIAHRELEQFLRDVREIRGRGGHHELKAALDKVEATATSALENDYNLVFQGD